MKKYAGMITLVVAAAILAGIYAVLSKTTDPAQTGQVYRFSSDETLQEISLKNGYGSYKFIKENGQWFLTQPGKYRASQQKLGIMEDFLLNLPINRVLDSELKEYGLAQPAITVDLITTKDDHQTLYIGNLTASKAQVYIKDAATNKVFVCNIGAVAQFDGSLIAYRDREIFTVDKKKISRLTYFKSGEKQMTVERSDTQGWQLTYPFTAPARIIDLNDITAKMRGWTAAGFPDDANSDPAALGLVNPVNSLDVSDLSGKTQHLEFGNTEGGMLYVRTGSSQDIAKLFSIDIDFKKFSAELLMFVSPLHTTIQQVSRIEIDKGNQQNVFEVNNSTVPPRISSGGKDVPYEEFISLFVKFINMNADGFDPKSKLGNPSMVLTTTYNDNSTSTLRLYNRDDSSFMMEINGKTEFYLKNDRVKQLEYQLGLALAAAK